MGSQAGGSRLYQQNTLQGGASLITLPRPNMSSAYVTRAVSRVGSYGGNLCERRQGCLDASPTIVHIRRQAEGIGPIYPITRCHVSSP